MASWVLLVACGSGGGPGTAQSTSGVYDPLPGMRLSARNQRLTPPEALFVHRVHDRLVRECMRSKGFPYLATPAEQPSPRVYLSPAELRRSGYGFDFDAYARELAVMNDSSRTFPADIDIDAYLKVLGGSPGVGAVKVRTGGGTVEAPATGCGAVARRKLFGTVPNAVHWESASDAYAWALSTALKAYRGYRGPLRRWEACMKDAGVDVRGFDSTSRLLLREIRPSHLGEGSGLPAGRVEAVAAADADCLESSGLHRARVRLMAQAERRAERSLGFEGGELAAFDQALLARAKRL